jgi:hypothetical protein
MNDESRLTRNLVAWIGVVSAVITVVLTIGNFWTKTRIDQREARLKDIETGLHQRAQEVEESKEKVARYTWVRSLFDDVNSEQPQKKTFSIALIRLALNKSEAEQLFGALAASSDQNLRQAGQKGLANLQSEATNQLVLQLTSENADDRRTATEALIQRYRASSSTISSVLKLFDERAFDDLSPSTVIDAFIFLGRTDPAAWNKEQAQLAQAAIAKVEKRGVGRQTNDALNSVKTTLKAIGTMP